MQSPHIPKSPLSLYPLGLENTEEPLFIHHLALENISEKLAQSELYWFFGHKSLWVLVSFKTPLEEEEESSLSAKQ